MPGYYPSTCETEITDHNCDPCAPSEYGRIRSVAYIKKTFEFIDPSDPAEWNAGVLSGDIIVIPFTSGSLAEPSEQVGPGYGDQVEKLLGFDFIATYKDPNYSENCDFYNALKRTRNYKFAYRTSSKVHIVDEAVTVIPKAPVDDDLTAEVTWTVGVKWKSEDFPCPFDAPAGVFDECFIQGE